MVTLILLVNNIDDSAIVYQNKTNDNKEENYIELKLKGSAKNINASWFKSVLCLHKHDVRTYEKFPVHGFLSSAEAPLHIGLNKTQVDSMFYLFGQIIHIKK